MDLIVFNLLNLIVVCSGLCLDSPLKRDSLCETVNCKQTKKLAPQIVARLVFMQEHLVCLICLLIFQLKNRLQLCSHSSLGWEIPKHMLQISETTMSLLSSRDHSQFISQKCRNKIKTIREHGRNIKKKTQIIQKYFCCMYFFA